MEQTKKSMKWLWWSLGVIVVVALVLVSNNKPSETGPIKIGFIGPLSGPAASYGEMAKNSVDLAVNEVNKAGGINGRQIEMVYEDGKCDGQDAASAAQKLVNIDNVKYIIGGICSGEVFSEIPITSPAKVFVISPMAGAAKLSGISKYFFRNNPSDAMTGAVLADYLSKSYKSVAVMSEQTDYAQGIKDVFITEAKKDGMNVVDTEDFVTGTTDFRSQLSKIKAQNPDVLVLNAQTTETLLNMAQQIKQIGLKAQVAGPLFGSDPKLYQAGAITDGMITVDLAGLAGDAGKAYLAKYQSVYNSVPTFQFYSGAAYDSVHLLSQAISSVGDNTDKVVGYFQKVSYSGVIGNYTFNQDGDMVGAGLVIHKISNKNLINL